VRRAFWLWWNDCTASGLGKGENQTTSSVLDTQSINALDQSRILPGDLAVTSSGVHVMAYLGSGKWIEAEPEAGRTIIVTPPSDNQWFKARMRIVRWRDLQE
jgi:cell wall-associated NlpC family hydrolase